MHKIQEIVMKEDGKMMDEADKITECADFKTKYVDFERDGAEFGRVIKECFRNRTVMMTAGELCEKLQSLKYEVEKEKE